MTTKENYDWDEHKKFGKNRSRDYDDAESFVDWLKIYLTRKKHTAIDPTHVNKTKAMTAEMCKKVYNGNTENSVRIGTARRYLNRLAEKPFVEKKDVPEEVRRSWRVADNAQHCYEYITTREKAEKFSKRERFAGKIQ